MRPPPANDQTATPNGRRAASHPSAPPSKPVTLVEGNETALAEGFRLWLENEQKGGHPSPSMSPAADPLASFLREVADKESADSTNPLGGVGVFRGVQKPLEGFDPSRFDLAKEGLNSRLIFASECHDHIEEGLAHHQAGKVSGNDGFFGAEIGHILSCWATDAGDTRRHAGALQARSAYADHSAAEQVEDALRASPDFAPAFAAPGEMERREREEAGETSSWPIVVGIAIGLLVACLVLAVLVVTWMRGDL